MKPSPQSLTHLKIGPNSCLNSLCVFSSSSNISSIKCFFSNSRIFNHHLGLDTYKCSFKPAGSHQTMLKSFIFIRCCAWHVSPRGWQQNVSLPVGTSSWASPNVAATFCPTPVTVERTTTSASTPTICTGGSSTCTADSNRCREHFHERLGCGLRLRRLTPASRFQVHHVRLFAGEEIYSDLYLTVCEWPNDHSKIVIFGFK